MVVILSTEVSLARNSTTSQSTNIEISPVTDFIKKINKSDGDVNHYGANVASNSLRILLKEKLMKPDKVKEVESFL